MIATITLPTGITIKYVTNDKISIEEFVNNIMSEQSDIRKQQTERNERGTLIVTNGSEILQTRELELKYISSMEMKLK